MTGHPSFELDWNLLKTFLAVAQAGSLAGGAQQIGITHPTAARHVQQLEEHLNMTLFTRSVRGLQLNSAGLRLQQCAESMHAGALEVEAACDALRAAPVEHLRVATPQRLAEFVPAVVFDQMDPIDSRLSVDLLVMDGEVDLLAREADIALMCHRPAHQELLCRRVGSLRLGVYTADEERVVGNLVDNLSGGDFKTPERTVFRSDSQCARLAAVRAGWGAGVFPVGSSAVTDLTWAACGGALDLWLAARPEVRDSVHLLDAFRSFGDAVAASLERAAQNVSAQPA